jgi:hypothetical protein
MTGCRVVQAGPAAAAVRAENAAWAIDFEGRPRIFSPFLTGEVPFQGALPFICLQATARTGRGTTAAAR